MTWIAAVTAALWLTAGAAEETPKEKAATTTLPTFTDITAEAGITFTHSFGDDELSNIVEGTGPGGLLFDYDGDGLLDIYFVNGAWRKEINDNRSRSLRGKLQNALYHNDGGGKFTDVTAAAGVGDKGYGMGASAGDYDGDGDLDLYVLNYGPNLLYRNDGGGKFTDVTKESGLDDPSWSLSAPWFDYDQDGDFDVYVANYLEYDEGAFRDFYAAAGYPGPLSYAGQQDHLYRNDGKGHFSDVTKEAGLTNPNGRSMSAVTVDLDTDGDLDIYVTNDAMPNSYWVSDGKGHFADEALEQGLAFGEGGQGASSMGPVIGDVDRNGLFDFWIPDMGYGCMLLQKEKGVFMDITAQSNLALICGQYTGWGGGLIDYDNDGFLDVYVANGNAHHLYTEEAVLARNDGHGKFIDVAKASGDYFQHKYVGRGAAFGDIDNDGDVDILAMSVGGGPHLLRNDGGNRRSWLTVVPRLKGTRGIAYGTQVIVTAGSNKMLEAVVSTNGYLSGSDPRAHFGLGDAKKAELVEIHWPDGKVQKLEDVAANQILEVVEGAD